MPLDLFAIKMDSFFEKINNLPIFPRNLIVPKIALYSRDFVAYLSRHPVTSKLQYEIHFEEDLPLNMEITRTMAIIIFSKIPDENIGHCSVLFVHVDENSTTTSFYIDSSWPGPPTSPYIREFIEHINMDKKTRTQYLTHVLQHPTYNTCGYWTLHAITYLARGLSFEAYNQKYRSYKTRHRIITKDLKMIRELKI